MATCRACGHDVVEAVVHGTETVLLDPHYKTWVGVDEHHFFPEDHDRVFPSSALVEHSAVCQVQRQSSQRERDEGKALYQRRKQPLT